MTIKQLKDTVIPVMFLMHQCFLILLCISMNLFKNGLIIKTENGTLVSAKDELIQTEIISRSAKDEIIQTEIIPNYSAATTSKLECNGASLLCKVNEEMIVDSCKFTYAQGVPKKGE